MEVNVHSEHRLTLNCMEYRTFTDTSEDVVFTNTWTCAKGEREWKSWGFHCKVQNRILTKNLVSVQSFMGGSNESSMREPKEYFKPTL